MSALVAHETPCIFCHSIEDDVTVPSTFCDTIRKPTEHVLQGDFSASAQFFCFVGVMSFLFCIFLVAAYVIFSPLFIKGSRAANIVSINQLSKFGKKKLYHKNIHVWIEQFYMTSFCLTRS